MKKRYKILLVTILVLAVLVHWIVQPHSLNPFAKIPSNFVASEIDIKCSPLKENSANYKSRLDSLVDGAISRNDFIGVSAGVYKQDCGTWLGTAGFKSKKSQERPDKTTVFRTASIAKPMTAVAIMQLYERQLIDLDVAIQNYLPEFPVKPEGDITIRQLLKHTSGIKHYSSMWDGISFTNYNNLVEALDEFKDRPLSFAPGTGYEYTTYGYTILGAIIEKVSGSSYQDFMKQNIFIPTGMYSTDLEVVGVEYPNKADLFIKLGDNFIRAPKTNLSVKYPGGGFHTTAEDLLKFGKAIIEHTLIDSNTLDLMVSSTESIKEGTPYGFGWFIYEHDRKGTILMHGGSQSGTSTEFNLMLDHGIVSASLANNFGSNVGTQRLCFGMSGLMYDLLEE